MRPSIHQVKQIYHDADEPFVFPLLKAYEARTREIASYKHDRLSDPDHPSGKILPREDESFSFDEGRFDHGDDEGDRQDRRQYAESDNIPEADLIDLHVSDESSPDKRDDYWVRFEEERSWHRYHVKARKDFFGDDTRPLPSGGRSKLISTMSESLIATSSTPETRSIATPVMCMPAAIGLEHTNSGPGLPSFSTRAARPKGGVPLPRSRSAKT